MNIEKKNITIYGQIKILITNCQMAYPENFNYTITSAYAGITLFLLDKKKYTADFTSYTVINKYLRPLNMIL